MSQVDNGKNILKYRLSSEKVVSPSQRCWYGNNCLQEFYKDKGLLDKSILVKREREGCGKKRYHTGLPKKTFNNRWQYFVIECGCVGFTCFTKF